MALDGIRNGHAKAVMPWERMFYIIALGQCEGPDHLDRLNLMDRLTDELVADLPPCLPQTGNRIRRQNARLRDVIRRFGRHPHRNAVLGRISTLDEEAYIASGDFPHVAKGPRPA